MGAPGTGLRDKGIGLGAVFVSFILGNYLSYCNPGMKMQQPVIFIFLFAACSLLRLVDNKLYRVHPPGSVAATGFTHLVQHVEPRGPIQHQQHLIRLAREHLGHRLLAASKLGRCKGEGGEGGDRGRG